MDLHNDPEESDIGYEFSDSTPNYEGDLSEMFYDDGGGDQNEESQQTTPRIISLHRYLKSRQNAAADILQDEICSPPEEDLNQSIEIFFGNLTSFGTICNSLNAKGSKTHANLQEETIGAPKDAIKMQQASLYDFARPVVVPNIGDYHGNFVSNSNVLLESMKLQKPDSDDSQGSDNGESSGSTEYESESASEYKTGNKTTTFKSRTDTESEPEFEAIPNPLNTSVDPCAVKKLCLVGHPLTSFKGLNNFKKLHEAWITNCNIKELKWLDFKGLKLLHRLYLFGGQITTVEPLHFENLRVLWLSNNKLTSLNFLTFGMQHLNELNVANNQITCLEVEDLYKCTSLQTLNVAGNPLCSIQDVECVNVVPTVKELYLVDPGYGKCPVASLCESRAILVSKLNFVTNLNGKEVTETERVNVERYIRNRILYYYASSAASGGYHIMMRKNAVQSAFKQLEILGKRIEDLATCSVKCLQGDFQMSEITVLATAKQQLLMEVGKVHTRLSSLKDWTRTILKRVQTILQISRWEQDMCEWLKLVELRSFGTIQSNAHSGLDPEATKDEESIRSTLHQLFSALACTKPWPRSTVLKLETIIVVRDKGAETGMEKIFEDNYARKNEPKFIPPPLEENLVQNSEALQPNGHQFYGPPVVFPYKVVPTYVDPHYKPPPEVFPFPESVPGLPERSQPLLMFLICQKGSDQTTKNDPLHYFHNLLFQKSRCFKEVRLTNCVWLATQLASKESVQAPSYSILFVVKVLEECLVPVCKATESYCYRRHSEDCIIFGLRRPLCFAPAYIVYVSHIHNDKATHWSERVSNDSDVTQGVDKLLTNAYNQMMELGMENCKKNTPYYLHRTKDGIKADLTAVFKVLEPFKNSEQSIFKPKSSKELLNIPNFLGSGIAESITSLDLSSNRLGLAVGLEGLSSLRLLNLSHNNLTTLSGLHKLPKLKEIRVGWNCLRFFHSNLSTLAWACNSLHVMEILPNPFQDIRDYSHIPVLANKFLPLLKRVDAWIAPFACPEKYRISTSEQLSCIANCFCKEILENTWAGANIIYIDYKGRCLSNLDLLSPFPYAQDITSTQQRNGILLNLGDNYLSSQSLSDSHLVQSIEWRAFLVKLELQENAITNLDWMSNTSFPSLRILNLTSNQLSEVDMISSACKNLLHLQIGLNPIPCNLTLLHPFKNLNQLVTLDASRTALATHPEYSIYIVKFCKSVKILDGIGISEWSTDEDVSAAGGIFSYDWLETHIGERNWNHLTELSLPNCGLKKIEFPPGSLPKLMSLDLSGNSLSSMAGLTALPKLRVLCLSNNRIASLGDSCPCCYDKSFDDLMPSPNLLNYQRAVNAEKQKFPTSVASQALTEIMNAQSNLSKTISKYNHVSSYFTNDQGSARKPKTDVSNVVFPKLEVLVLAHNGLSSINDLHLHSLPSLRTVLLNCNKIKGLQGLDNLSTVQAIVLDNNHITHVPFSSMSGCKSLKYIHLEHNRIASLPRFPNIQNLTALHIAYNRIQSLTDIGTLAQLEIQELTLEGNPSCKGDYWKNIVVELPELRKLDGVGIVQLQKVTELGKINCNTDSEDWEDVDELPPGFIPEGGLKVKPLHALSTFLAKNNSKRYEE